MKIQDEHVKENLLGRLSRIEGQLRGVQGMLKDERDCREIMQQLSAVHAAVKSTSRVFLKEYAATCLLGLDGDEPPGMPAANRDRQREQMIEDMIALFDKTP